MEPRESRIALATFTVNSLADAGAGSLHQAMLDANSAAGADEIVFQDALRDGMEMVVDVEKPETNHDSPGLDGATLVFHSTSCR